MAFHPGFSANPFGGELMAGRKTKEIQYVRLPEKRIREIEELVATWPYETKAFMRARLNQYAPQSNFITAAKSIIGSIFIKAREKRFAILEDPEILTDWQKRFTISGQTNPLEAWNKILEKELCPKEYIYLLYLLEKELTDVHVPPELEELFEKLYRAFIRKEYTNDSATPKAPLLLIIGPTGSGKTATVRQAIEDVIFANKVLPEIDMKQKKEEVLAQKPFWKTIEEIEPTLAMEFNQRKKLHFYKRLSKISLLKRIFKKRIGRNLMELQEQGLTVDYAMITPNDYQTALAGEPGNYFKKALGDPQKTAIRHVEEAHSAFGKSEGRQRGVERQQRTLIDTSNIVLDEIIHGRRDCLLIATSDRSERFDSAIYRRFVEKGKIIDISDFWQHPENLAQIVQLELVRHNIRVSSSGSETDPIDGKTISLGDLERSVDKIYAIFQERTLNITPAYIRKLVASIIEIKTDFSPTYLEDQLLVRRAFELVAKHLHGDLYKKVVDRMDRRIRWEAYIGNIKDMFSEMANNCLYYGVNDEKGVVLNGPPGSGKTFLVRSWLSENRNVHDLAISPDTLQDPANPVEGAAYNLEKVYDIGKMIAPSLIFMDEGDSLAPKRSSTGGSPSDRLTNKFLNLIDGEIPLNRIFTVLTTNRLDILDPALTRSKRLKVMAVAGHLESRDIHRIINRLLADVPLAPELGAATIADHATGICNTPADYAAFVEKILALRHTEYEVLKRFQALSTDSDEIRNSFISFNLKTLLGILAAAGIPRAIRSEISDAPQKILSHFQQMKCRLDGISDIRDYPLVSSHLRAARREISQSPVQKGKIQLEEFLEAELSREPQVGFIVGVGANDVSGILLPIATSLTYRETAEKIIVTGAVSSTASAAAELDMAVQMTRQSAKEAFTMVENYLQTLTPQVNVTRILGEFYQHYCLHHQLLSASYNVGGPSAGYALAINTLSTLLHIPVDNDFGITGAPWTKGVRSGEVGSSVLIGGHKKKTEKVLMYLERMYLPQKNFDDLEKEFLLGYWRRNKDIVAVTHFGDLVPEVLWLGDNCVNEVKELISSRIRYRLIAFRKTGSHQAEWKHILKLKAELKKQVEGEIVRRLSAIRKYLQKPGSDPHLSLEKIVGE
jgi:SpoVK/Ycf46/Vps4 family AAA+-type ATPase